MPTQTELEVLACFRDAKVEGRSFPIRERVPFQENYIQILLNALGREELLEWDERLNRWIITRKGLEVANKLRPRRKEEGSSRVTLPRKTRSWRY